MLGYKAWFPGEAGRPGVPEIRSAVPGCNVLNLLKRIKTRNCRKMSKKCPKMPFGDSWQLPRKMSKKCLENVLVLGLALDKCPENV